MISSLTIHVFSEDCMVFSVMQEFTIFKASFGIVLRKVGELQGRQY
ncbi:hypothetical protein RchiOBHm_Chr7g0216821 [Rosa chinensis]|uniref:Uncharacterized protein n=1 Tax=Rosa chinensis TaxID=74649 RepID=A0A2P6PBW5_ROSCH|nr:hypothetical protein RchiOBHm_Chr7g0216821 [Rosa chinensis]